jgi:CubicO group peptidase (beta-lactamase class C family)
VLFSITRITAMDDLDHRNLGVQLKLWHLQEDAPGMVFWHPRGYALYRVLDLLCHRTGLPRHDWVHEPGDRGPAEILAVMRHLELSRDVRAEFQYNNLCYNVAGLLIERLSGQSYESFIRARLADRLGMTVGFSLDDLEASGESARPYMMHEDTRVPAPRLPIRTTASGAMTTSVAGFANWMRLHLGKGEWDGERLLPAQLIGELHAPRVYIPMQSPYAEFDGAHYGLGFQCTSYRGDRLIWHGGGWPGWNTQMTLVPHFGIGVAVFTNRSPNGVTEALTYYAIDYLRARPRAGRMARALPSAARGSHRTNAGRQGRVGESPPGQYAAGARDCRLCGRL